MEQPGKRAHSWDKGDSTTLSDPRKVSVSNKTIDYLKKRMYNKQYLNICSIKRIPSVALLLLPWCRMRVARVSPALELYFFFWLLV